MSATPPDLPPIDLTALGDSLRRLDHDRYVTTMFADPSRRAGVWALYAFNAEVAQVRQQVREPLAGMIRLQWWRDVVDGIRGEEALRNPVAGPLLRAMAEHGLDAAEFHAILDARQQADLEPSPFVTQTQWLEYGRDVSGRLARLAAAILGAPDCAQAEAAGTAWALTGLLRSLPFHLAQGWNSLPHDVLLRVGLDSDTVLAAKADKAALARAVMILADHAAAQIALARQGRAPRQAVAAVLPAVMAAAHLGRIRSLGGDVFDSRSYRPRPMPLRLAWAALWRRV